MSAKITRRSFVAAATAATVASPYINLAQAQAPSAPPPPP